MESWDLYQQTVFVLGKGVEVSHLPGALGIVTAWNPDGQDSGGTANLRADEQLFAALVGGGCRPLRVTGCSPDGSHEEAGWLFGCDCETAVWWGQEYRQEAVYWVDGDALHLVGCGMPASRCALGSFRERLVLGA